MKQILLNFRINEEYYCVYLNLESNIAQGMLYATQIDSIENIKSLKSDPIINEAGLSKFSNKMESFFFQHFSYYSMKWTQKDSRKDSDQLLEATASWKTYFKSIFLESKDIALQYGSQEKRIFQMLLGLQLTYSINRLTVKVISREKIT